ncbi:MAG TPA: helix-turn-helix transcriptional regulator [Pirellulales bacterium]|jgi:transcriptional regulator with XRE-family HTH domain
MASTRDFADVLRKKIATDPRLAAAVAEARFQANIAEQIYTVRTEAGLTQTQLARRIGTHQSVIARLEDADYEGHTFSMLRRIADATGKELFIAFKESNPGSGPVTVEPHRAPAQKAPPLNRRSAAGSKLKSAPKSAPSARKKKRSH